MAAPAGTEFGPVSRVADTLRRGADPAAFFRDDGTLRIHPSVLLEACGLAGVSVLDVCRRPRPGEDALSDEGVVRYLLEALHGLVGKHMVVNEAYMQSMGAASDLIYIGMPITGKERGATVTAGVRQSSLSERTLFAL